MRNAKKTRNSVSSFGFYRELDGASSVTKTQIGTKSIEIELRLKIRFRPKAFSCRYTDLIMSLNMAHIGTILKGKQLKASKSMDTPIN